MSLRFHCFMAKKKPWGITLATILLVISGIMTLLGALVSLFLGALLGAILPSEVSGYVGVMMIFMALIYIVMGVAYITVAYFLWERKTWAWWVAIILAGIGIPLGLTSILALSLTGLLMLALNVVVIIGLLQKDSKKYCKVKLNF